MHDDFVLRIADGYRQGFGAPHHHAFDDCLSAIIKFGRCLFMIGHGAIVLTRHNSVKMTAVLYSTIILLISGHIFYGSHSRRRMLDKIVFAASSCMPLAELHREKRRAASMPRRKRCRQFRFSASSICNAMTKAACDIPWGPSISLALITLSSPSLANRTASAVERRLRRPDIALLSSSVSISSQGGRRGKVRVF